MQNATQRENYYKNPDCKLHKHQKLKQLGVITKTCPITVNAISVGKRFQGVGKLTVPVEVLRVPRRAHKRLTRLV